MNVSDEVYGLPYRRHNAVLMSHPRIRLKEWPHLFESLLVGRNLGAVPESPWIAADTLFTAQSRFFGSGALQARGVDGTNTTPYPVHLARPINGPLAIAESPSGAVGVVLIIAPYVRLLQRILSDLEHCLGQPRPWYLALDPSRAFRVLVDPPDEDAKVRQFSVQVRSGSSADRVSISGRNPLRADLGREFAEAAIANDVGYDVRLQISKFPGFSTNLNVDRHGNAWWFHRGPESLQNVLPGLDLLSQLDLMRWTRLRPPDHRDDEDNG